MDAVERQRKAADDPKAPPDRVVAQHRAQTDGRSDAPRPEGEDEDQERHHARPVGAHDRGQGEGATLDHEAPARQQVDAFGDRHRRIIAGQEQAQQKAVDVQTLRRAMTLEDPWASEKPSASAR